MSEENVPKNHLTKDDSTRDLENSYHVTAFENQHYVISLKKYNETGQESYLINLACSISKYTHYFPKNYRVFLQENSELFFGGDRNIFSLSSDFPISDESEDFAVDLLTFNVGEDIFVNGVDYGSDAIVGMSITASNGESFIFYLEQLKMLNNHIVNLSFAEDLEEILAAESE